MRTVNRSTVTEPPILKKARPSDGKTELQLATEHMAQPEATRGKFEFTRYSEASVKVALEQLFHGKCAYCESVYSSTQPVDVEHYRPKAEVDGVDGHPGYWWLAMEWTNLLPSCIDCNRKRNQKTPDVADPRMVQLNRKGDFNRSKTVASGKESVFPLEAGSPRATAPGPVVETERRLLLDPTRDNPADHIEFLVDRNHLVGLVYPKPTDGAAIALPPAAFAGNAGVSNASVKGAISIQVYGLNRLGLVQARTRALRDLEFLLAMTTALIELANETDELIEKKRSLRLTATGAFANSLDDDLDHLPRLAEKIRRLADGAKRHVRQMTEEASPYSVLAKTWVRELVK